MIERAGPRDLELVAAVALRAHQRSGDAAIEVDPQAARLHVARILVQRDGMVLLHRPAAGAAPDGVLIGQVMPFWFSKARHGWVLLAYSEAPFALVPMVRQFARWALEERGAARVVFDASFGGAPGEMTDRLYRRAGFRRVGGAYCIGG